MVSHKHTVRDGVEMFDLGMEEDDPKTSETTSVYTGCQSKVTLRFSQIIISR